MKTFKIFSMAAVALCLAACSNSDDYSVQMPTQSADVLHFEATVAAPNADASMRTVYTVDGTNINVKWEVGDKIAAIVVNSENKFAKTELTVSKVNDDGSAVISGDITKPKDGELKVDLIYPADIVTVVANGSDYRISFMKMSNGTLDGTLESIANNIDYRMADDCALTVSGDKATLTSAAKLESKLSIWKLTLKKEDNSDLSASKVAIGDGTGVMASATLASAASEVYLPVLVDAMSADIVISATEGSDNYYYLKKNVTLAAKKYYQSTVQMTKGAHLAFLTADYVAKDGETLTGTLASNVKISIAAPVAPATTTTVTLKDANINGSGTWTSGNYAGITCVGDATINLEGTNTVKGFDDDYPGIYVPNGKKLTIDGTGSLDASSTGSGAGIGGGYDIVCGNIAINGGTITATGGDGSAGIGGGVNGSCNITINGGTVTATGGDYAAGIGGGMYGSCNINISGGTVNATGGTSAAGIGSGYFNNASGAITITSGVTKVTATAGTGGPCSIGKGDEGTGAISVTIGGTVYASGISTSPFEYSPIPATAHALSASVVGDVVGSDGNAYTLDATHVLPSGVTAVAMVAYVGSDNGETAPYNHGLALALSDANGGSGCSWSTSYTEIHTYNASSNSFTSEGGLQYNDATHNTDTYPAFKAAIANNGTAAPTGCSAWFLATGYQWKQMADAAGGYDKLGLSGYYWSSTEGVSYRAWYFNSGDGSWYRGSKGGEYLVRSCLAF